MVIDVISGTTRKRIRMPHIADTSIVSTSRPAGYGVATAALLACLTAQRLLGQGFCCRTAKLISGGPSAVLYRWILSAV